MKPVGDIVRGLAVDTGQPVSHGIRNWAFVAGIATTFLGAWAFFFPQSFFEDFPIEGAHWVSTLGHFNEHLMRDYGGAQVGLGITAILVALRSSSIGIAAAMTGFIVFGALHLGYHFTTFGLFSPGSSASQAIALTLFVVIPFAVLRAIQTRNETEK